MLFPLFTVFACLRITQSTRNNSATDIALATAYLLLAFMRILRSGIGLVLFLFDFMLFVVRLPLRMVVTCFFLRKSEYFKLDLKSRRGSSTHCSYAAWRWMYHLPVV